MRVLKYIASGLKPGITFDVSSCLFEIYGKSCPENVVEFYQPVLEWLDEYIRNPLEESFFEFRLSYFNTATSKVLFAIMYKLEFIAQSGKYIKVKWFYPEEDEALFEAGKEFQDLVEVPFELIPEKIQ
jgi:hypothetical protein